LAGGVACFNYVDMRGIYQAFDALAIGHPMAAGDGCGRGGVQISGTRGAAKRRILGGAGFLDANGAKNTISKIFLVQLYPGS
jgi:hypothetical protein